METQKDNAAPFAPEPPRGHAQGIQKRVMKPLALFTSILAGTCAAFCLFPVRAFATTVTAVYNSESDVPVTASGYTAAGNTINFTLNFAPITGTDLLVVENTGLTFIEGTFDNLAQGQTIFLSFGGTTYRFVANYFGGSGNDLVLHWTSVRAYAWGFNHDGELGNGSTVNSRMPVAVTTTGVLAGERVIALAGGTYHTLALCADGKVAAWGHNVFGQVGDGTALRRLEPVAVSTASGVSALWSKVVVAISAGGNNSLVLCADGTIAAWGDNSAGQIGDGTTMPHSVPVTVSTASDVSALFGKKPVAVGAGGLHSLALCSDGSVAAWGANNAGQLGDNSQVNRRVPVPVNTNVAVSALYDRTVMAIAAGAWHSLALCSDGTIAAWGQNSSGQLGDNTTMAHAVPVAVNTAPGISALYGKTVVAIAAGAFHNLALCSDGTVAAWGQNTYGQLGDTTVINSSVPVAVNTAAGVSALYGKRVVAVATGGNDNLALCSDGTLVAWGQNTYGQAGDGTITNRFAPVVVSTTSLTMGQCFTRIFGGAATYTSLVLVAAPPPCEIGFMSAERLENGPFRFAFTNTPGAFFGVLAGTNPALPSSNWMPIGDPVEVSPGQFQFTDLQATNSPQRFYRVLSP